MAEQAHDAAQEEAQDIDLLQDALLDAVDPPRTITPNTDQKSHTARFKFQITSPTLYFTKYAKPQPGLRHK